MANENLITQLRSVITQMIMPLRNRVYTMITRAVIETVKDSGNMQLVKLTLLAGETRDDIERFQNFGFSSNPPDGSECVAVAIGGNRDHLIVIVADDRNTRIKDLLKGESVQYNDKGDKWHIKNDGTLEGTLSKNLEVTLTKLKFKNASNELIDLIVQLADETAKGETNTIFGPLKKNNFAAINAIKTKLETFKV